MSAYLVAGAFASSPVQINGEEKDPLSKPQWNWNYQQRNPGNAFSQNPQNGLWPRPGLLQGASDGAIFGTDPALNAVWYELPPSWFLGGTRKPQYFNGIVRDANGAPVSGVRVKAFLTAADTTNIAQGVQPADSLQGSGVSNGAGVYEVYTFARNQAHYLVAYLPGTPDTAGTTVNTLIPAE